MKFVLKILFAPVIAALVVLVSALALILNLSAWVFGIASTILGILGLAVLLLDNVVNGVIILVIAFLVSPIGLPMLAAWMLGQIQRFRYFIQDAVYG
ncbi:MAG: CD1845 family protein [Eubacteriales bacterium]